MVEMEAIAFLVQSHRLVAEKAELYLMLKLAVQVEVAAGLRVERQVTILLAVLALLVKATMVEQVLDRQHNHAEQEVAVVELVRLVVTLQTTQAETAARVQTPIQLGLLQLPQG
jgi:hypothetical protein